MIYPSLCALLTEENRSSPGYLCVISKYLVRWHPQLGFGSIRGPPGGAHGPGGAAPSPPRGLLPPSPPAADLRPRQPAKEGESAPGKLPFQPFYFWHSATSPGSNSRLFSFLPPLPPTKGALCAPRALPAAARCVRAPAARGPRITALRRDAGRPRPLLWGSSPFGRGALCPPTPQRAERGWWGPHLHSPNKEPLSLPFLRPSVIPLFLRLVLDAPQAGWRWVGTSLSSQGSSRFLRSGKSVGLGCVGRGPPTLILGARGLRPPQWQWQVSASPWPSQPPLGSHSSLQGRALDLDPRQWARPRLASPAGPPPRMTTLSE